MYSNFNELIQNYFKIQPINCILEPDDGKAGLYLGNIFAATDLEILKQSKIGAVLTVASNTELEYRDMKHMIIPVLDVEQTNLLQYFDQMLEFIDENRKTTNVFVHCFAGVSRSSTAVIAYIMKKFNLTMY